MVRELKCLSTLVPASLMSATWIPVTVEMAPGA